MDENRDFMNTSGDYIPPAQPAGEEQLPPMPQQVYEQTSQPQWKEQYSRQNKKMGTGDALAIAGLCCGIFALLTSCFCLGWVPAIAAVILGIVAIVLKSRKKTMAIVSVILGIVAVIVMIVLPIIFSIFGFANAVRDYRYDPYDYYDYEYDFPYDSIF